MSEEIKPPMTARERLLATIKRDEVMLAQKRAKRAADPVYQAAQVVKLAERALKQKKKTSKPYKSEHDRIGGLTALAGEFSEVEISLAVYSETNYRMGRNTWSALLAPIQSLLIRQPDFKGIVRFGKRTIPVVAVLGSLDGGAVALDLFELVPLAGRLNHLATGHMSGNLDLVNFKFPRNNLTVSCELVTLRGNVKGTNTPRYHYVVGQDLHERMFGLSVIVGATPRDESFPDDTSDTQPPPAP